jgi:hypothetical protein
MVDVMNLANKVHPTNIFLVEEGHSLIADKIDEIYEALASKKEITFVLEIVDDLITQTENYLNQRTNCQNIHECTKDVYASTVVERLFDLHNVIEEFGPNMAPAAAITEVRNWAQQNIYQPAKRCKNCEKMS